MTTPEFSRTVRLDALGDLPRTIELVAEEGERAALARRFDVVAIARLAATLAVTRSGSMVWAEGRVRAAVTQACVATGVPIDTVVDEPMALRFVPAEEGSPDEEVELEEGDLDVVPYLGGAVDLGEAVAETLALALDPFPRAPEADTALRAAGVLGEGEAGPFGALRTLRDRLGGTKP